MTALAVLAGLAFGWFSYRYAWWRLPVDAGSPRILMYHMISSPRPGARFNGLRVAPELFERQLRWLCEQGWTSYTVSELVELGERVPPRAFSITFDDGYADNLENALPLLEKYNCKATLYLVVDRFDRDWSMARKAHHDEGELRNEPKLSDGQVERLIDSGRVELGSHSVTHANFARLGEAEVTRELVRSRQLLEQRFSVSVTSFAYPFGIYRPAQASLLAGAGYRSAVTVNEGIDAPPDWKPMELRRIKISGRDNWLAFLLRMRGGRRGWK